MLVTLLSPVLIVLVAPGVLARHVVPLHRQRVPVQGDDDRISYKSVYFGSVVVGKPEQKFSVVFDTGSGHVILPSSECHSETCLIHNRYNRQASDGAVDVDYDGTPVRSGAPRDQITVAFGTGEVTGQFVHDRICLSPEAPASQSAGTSAGSANTEPLLLVQSGDALERHRGENISAMDQSSKMDKNSTSPTQLRHEAMNCVDLRVVMATEMTEEPFHAFAFDGVLGLGAWKVQRQELIRFTKETSRAHWEAALQSFREAQRSELQLDATAATAGSACAAASAAQWQLAVHLLALPCGALKLGNMALEVSSDLRSDAFVSCGPCFMWYLSFGCFSVLRVSAPFSYGVAQGLQQSATTVPSAGLQATQVTAGATSQATPWRRAFAVLENFDASEIEDNAIAFNAILSSCSDARPVFILDLLHSMQKRRVRATVISYNSAITACKKSWELSVHLLKDMEHAQLLPDSVSFNSAITASETGANWQLAVPNLTTFNSAAASYEKAGRWELAAKTLDLVQPGLITYNCVLRSCLMRWQFTLQLLRDMSKAAILADLISYNMAALACEGSQHFTDHFQVLLDKVLPRSLQELLHSLHSLSQLDSLALAPEFSFFGMMAKQVALEESNFGVFLADSDDEISEISFGGISHDKITSALTWAKVASPELGYWQVQVTSIRIGNRTLDYCNDGQCRAVVDTGTSLLAVPEDFAEQLQQELETALRDPTPSASGGGFVKDAFPELFVEGQVVSAEQSFHRRLAEYEMRLDLRSWLPRFLSVAFDARVRVRLLTSFARLSIPTRKELEEVAKAPLVPMVERFRMLGKRLGMDQARAEALKFIPRPAVGCVDVLLWLEQKLTDSQLFLRLAIQEGINQMLQALSYYIVGSIAEETPSGAALSLLGVQVLSLLLLRLDMAEGMQQWSAVFAVIVFMAFPPLYIGILIHLVPMLSVRTVEFFALPAFMLHSDRAGSVSSNGRHGEQLQQLEAQLRAEVLEARFKFQTGGEKSCKGELYNLRPSDSARREIRRAERTLEHFTLWKAACSEITGAYQHFLTRCQELDLGICDSRRIHKLEFGSCSVDASDVLGARGGYEERMAEIHRDLFVSNRFGRFQGHIDQLRIETLEEMSEEESGVQEDAELQIPTQWPLWCTQSCKGCEGERWVAGWTGEEIFVGVAKNSAMRTRYALRASFASCRGSKTWPKTAAIFGSCSMVEENYTDVQALHMMKGGQLLVLHKGSLLDAWDLPEGNLLGRFSVHGPSPAAAFCILEESLTPQLLVAYGKPLVGGAFVASVVADFMPGLERKQWLYVREPNKGAWFTDAVSLSVDCRHAAGLPLHFDVEGRSITLLPADYSRQAVHAEEFSPVNSSVQEKSTSASDLSEPMASQAKRPTCQPTIMPLELPEPLGPKLFIWGEPVLRKYYTVYDWKEKQIGFGLAAHTPPQVSADEEAKQLRGRGLLFA
eukprot:symbB.v1.2.024068.t2/scaffold2253.1/size89778/1